MGDCRPERMVSPDGADYSRFARLKGCSHDSRPAMVHDEANIWK